MEIADRRAEEGAADQAEHRIAEIFVEHRHGAGRDAAFEAIAHHQLGAVAQRGEEGHQGAEIIAVVGVA
ncbi:hypothetical protein QU38_02930, partial [Staphylococcus aureus]